MIPIVITVKPVDRYGTFDAYLGERLLTTSHQPFLDSARVLLAEGIDPATPMVMRHARRGRRARPRLELF
jgi:hypothetical protein